MCAEIIVEMTRARYARIKRRAHPAAEQMPKVSILYELRFQHMMNVNQMGQIEFDQQNPLVESELSELGNQFEELDESVKHLVLIIQEMHEAGSAERIR
jgi:hypothetical protein